MAGPILYLRGGERVASDGRQRTHGEVGEATWPTSHK